VLLPRANFWTLIPFAEVHENQSWYNVYYALPGVAGQATTIIPPMPRPIRPNSPPGAPWIGWEIGTRVVVRYRLPDGRFSDALGPLEATGPEAVTVLTRRGPMTIPADLIAIAKVVPPVRRTIPRTMPEHQSSSPSSDLESGASQT
jgi:hypothetical protein